MSNPECWQYSPQRHKGQHHERSRTIFLGPRAIGVLRPLLGLDISGIIFSPRRAAAEHNAQRREERKTPLYPSHVAHQKHKKKGRARRVVGNCYSVGNYRQAIHRASDRAGFSRWSPHQLRHTRADEVQRSYGPDGSKASLGHSSLNATKVYLSRDLALAREVAKRIG
jgi:integrase